MEGIAFDLATFAMRAVVGVFFILYRFRWFYDPTQPDPVLSLYRQAKLRRRLRTCGYSTHPAMCAFVSLAEMAGGIALLVGFLTRTAAAGILVILLFATFCTAWENTVVQKPVDRVDVVSCYLRTIEPLYILLLAVIVLLGAGTWSVDHLLGWSF